MTEETFLKAEKTELDAHFENLLQRADKTEEHTKRLLSAMESYLQPNPSMFLKSSRPKLCVCQQVDVPPIMDFVVFEFFDIECFFSTNMQTPSSADFRINQYPSNSDGGSVLRETGITQRKPSK